MSVLEQYTYDGSRKPDFQALPTLVVPDEAMPADGTEASGNCSSSVLRSVTG